MITTKHTIGNRNYEVETNEAGNFMVYPIRKDGSRGPYVNRCETRQIISEELKEMGVR